MYWQLQKRNIKNRVVSHKHFENTCFHGVIVTEWVFITNLTEDKYKNLNTSSYFFPSRPRYFNLKHQYKILFFSLFFSCAFLESAFQPTNPLGESPSHRSVGASWEHLLNLLCQLPECCHHTYRQQGVVCVCVRCVNEFWLLTVLLSFLFFLN